MKGCYEVIVLIPAYNESFYLWQSIQKLIQSLEETSIGFSIVIIDDGSTDNTLDIINRLQESDNRITLYTMKKNVGKDIALFSCLCDFYKNAKLFLTLDSDMQLPLLYIKKMLELINRDPDIDIVSGVRESRNDENVVYRTVTILFYCLLHKMTGYDMKLATDYKLFNASVAKLLCEQYKSGNQYFRGACESLSIKHVKIPVILFNSNRTTRFSIARYIRHARIVLTSCFRQRKRRINNERKAGF